MSPSASMLGIFLAAGVSLATWLEPWFQSWAGSRTASANIIEVALGDSRRVFARHFFEKADAYFHSGYYPSMFDDTDAFARPHVIEGSGGHQEETEREAADFLGEPRDWIDRFSRHFFPSKHRHLGERSDSHDENCTDADHHHQSQIDPGAEREVLPWLWMAAELDPGRVETYTTTAYWLRTALGKVDEAEEFLRQGLRANPGNPELLFELGLIYARHHKNVARARNLWEIALRRWQEIEDPRREPNVFLLAQICDHLARLEEEQGNLARAIEVLEVLKPHSPGADHIQKWIDEMRSAIPAE